MVSGSRPERDEFFLILDGRRTIQLRGRTVVFGGSERAATWQAATGCLTLFAAPTVLPAAARPDHDALATDTLIADEHEN